jgi:hypothetical protein
VSLLRQTRGQDEYAQERNRPVPSAFQDEGT